MRHWQPNGFKISVLASLLAGLVIGLFFMVAPGWRPPDDWRDTCDVAVSWILLSYIWIQLGSLVMVGAGTRHQMWLDALTSVIPLFLIVYALLLHYSGFVILSSFQAGTAWLTAYTMLLDVVLDLGISVMLSRQVVDVGGRGA